MREERVDLDLPLAEASPALPLSEERETDFLDRFIVLAEQKIFILKFAGIAAVLSTVVAFVLPHFYSANAKLMPPQQSQSSVGAMLNQLGFLGVIAGSQLGLRDPREFYADVLHSRTVADDLIQRFSVMDVVDKGVRPMEKSWSPRGVIVFLATLTAFFVAVPFVLLRESWKRTKDEDPRQAAQLQRLKFARRISGNS